ncbi:hypothetical protein BDV06DRAFT_185776 [Aspergillus oleicola]
MGRSGELSFLPLFGSFSRSVSSVHLRAWWLGLTPSEPLAPWFRNIHRGFIFGKQSKSPEVSPFSDCAAVGPFSFCTLPPESLLGRFH